MPLLVRSPVTALSSLLQLGGLWILVLGMAYYNHLLSQTLQIGLVSGPTVPLEVWRVGVVSQIAFSITVLASHRLRRLAPFGAMLFAGYWICVAVTMAARLVDLIGVTGADSP